MNEAVNDHQDARWGDADAQEDPADRRRFVLPAERWDEFMAFLDREPADRPRLAALLSSPSILDPRE